MRQICEHKDAFLSKKTKKDKQNHNFQNKTLDRAYSFKIPFIVFNMFKKGKLGGDTFQFIHADQRCPFPFH